MTATFSITRDDAITKALQVVGALAKGETADATDISDCAMYLGALLKFWNTQKGFAAWCYENITWPAVAGQQSYTIGESAANVANERPLRIANAWTVSVATGDLLPLSPKTRDEFFRLSPRNSPGPTTTYYYDPQLPNGVFHVWGVPTDTSRSFAASITRPIGDITAGASTFDVPQEGYLAIIWGLAALVMGVYGAEENNQKRIEKNAGIFLASFMDFNEEDGSIFFQPSYQGGR